MTFKSINSEFDQKIEEEKMLQWSNKCSEFEHTIRVDENGTRVNDCQSKPNTVERLAESTRAASVRIFAVFEQICGRT